jgi:two-component system OmpR family sensor kinase
LTLRLRLVIALVALVTVAQGGFFLATYLFYKNSEYQRLDAQLRSAAPVMDQYLDFLESGGSGNIGPGQGPPGEGPSLDTSASLPPGIFGEQFSANGLPRYHLLGEVTPKLPSPLPAVSPEGRFFSANATSGSTKLRVYEIPARDGGVTVVALPTTEVTSALNRLVLIEAAAIAGLLIVLSGGAWLVMRHGLRPLERMAHTAGQISAGDLSPRVSPSGGASEVGQLGLALNTMLGRIESAFAEREATEQKLRQFLADASHELRTPLTSIQGFAELFRVSGESAGVDLPTILRRIEEESARMKILVEDLLTLARLDEHREVERKPVDLAVLLADACTDAVATDRSRPVTLDAPEPVVVSGDEAHLRQAIANLLTNALRHTPPGTPIEAGCQVTDHQALVTVRDHGPGLDPDSLMHVFDRFWQGDKARVGTGTGLGLSIVSAIASEHGGMATATNAPDGGALFTIKLPVTA